MLPSHVFLSLYFIVVVCMDVTQLLYLSFISSPNVDLPGILSLCLSFRTLVISVSVFYLLELIVMLHENLCYLVDKQ